MMPNMRQPVVEIDKKMCCTGGSLKLFKAAALLVGIVFFGAVAIVWARWPFSRQAVLKELQDASLSKVQFDSFHGTYFPRPGCVLENVIFQHNPRPGTPPLITVERLRVEGTFFGLFTKHIRRIRAEGMHILIPSGESGEHFQTPKRSTIVIDDLIADGAILELASHEPGKQPLKFVFDKFSLIAVGSRGPASYSAKFSNPEPPGEIITQGQFGPWNADDVGKTPVSGEYLFQQADLGMFKGVAGILSSSGKFWGMLDHIDVQGTTDTPNFTVVSSSHIVQLRTQFQAAVNGKNGDTYLQAVMANFWNTTVRSEGSIAGNAGEKGKTSSIDLATKDGRIEDLLRLFTRSKQAPMSGMVSFKAKVSIPPGPRAFLEKVELQGDFGIDGGKFTKINTQEGVNRLSEGARGQKDHPENKVDLNDPETVLSDLKGHVLLKDGTASFSNLSFNVPGASAQLHGTYNLITEKIDLRGTLKTNSELAKTTHGMKAFMLKILDPFFKKHQGGYAAPVKITGTYKHPSFGLDLSDRNNKHHGKQAGAS
jgi:hypothetical protein